MRQKRIKTNMRTREGEIGLAIHGGAGTIARSKMTPEMERELRAGLQRALDAGHEILKNGGSSLDAVVASVRAMEDDPLFFNAGKGAVFTGAGTHEMDAAIMDGATFKGRSGGGLRRVKNPISLARAVMEDSPHVMFVGEVAELFARQIGVELVDEKYFYTEERWRALQRVQKAEADARSSGKEFVVSDQDRHGTVGAVALDRAGNLAAATSTGGNTNKRPGRLGDTPIIGAGTYANNQTCAMSATGDAQAVIAKITDLGGAGGLIAIDKDGNISLPFNTAGMYRGHVNSIGQTVIEIYK